MSGSMVQDLSHYKVNSTVIDGVTPLMEQDGPYFDIPG